jgi:hypothetical protein
VPYVNVSEENGRPVELYFEDHVYGQPVVLIHRWQLWPFLEEADASAGEHGLPRHDLR